MWRDSYGEEEEDFSDGSRRTCWVPEVRWGCNDELGFFVAPSGGHLTGTLLLICSKPLCSEWGEVGELRLTNLETVCLLQEDIKLIQLVETYGPQNWSLISKVGGCISFCFVTF